MKRTISLMFLLILEFLVLALSLLLNNSYLIGVLFLLNFIFFIFLVKEPYWKKGAALSFLVFFEINFFIFNIFVMEFKIFFFYLVSLLTILFGLLIVLLAHRMKTLEKRHAIHMRKKSYNKNKEEKNPKYGTLVLVGKTVHLEDCDVLEDVPEKDRVILGSKRYAKSKKYKPCKKCKPF